MPQQPLPLNVAVSKHWPALLGVPIFLFLSFAARAPASVVVLVALLLTAPAFFMSARRVARWSFWVFSVFLVLPALALNLIWDRW